MPRTSHPQPDPLPGRAGLHTPRELLPLDTTSDFGPPPALPSPPRTFPDASWVLSTHLVPCALPRTVPDVPPIALPAWSEGKERRKEAAREVVDRMVVTRMKQWGGELLGEGSRKPLWVCLNRYRRTDLSESETEGVTLFFVHANGFPKEVRRGPSPGLALAHPSNVLAPNPDLGACPARTHQTARSHKVIIPDR